MNHFEVLLAPEAERDLYDIHAFIAHMSGHEQANSIQDKLMDGILTLETLPTRGKLPQECTRMGVYDIRELHIPPWRIFYSMTTTAVHVLAVLDGRRDMQELLRLRLLAATS